MRIGIRKCNGIERICATTNCSAADSSDLKTILASSDGRLDEQRGGSASPQTCPDGEYEEQQNNCVGKVIFEAVDYWIVMNLTPVGFDPDMRNPCEHDGQGKPENPWFPIESMHLGRVNVQGEHQGRHGAVRHA